MTHDASTGGGIEQIEEHYKTFIVRYENLTYVNKMSTFRPTDRAGFC